MTPASRYGRWARMTYLQVITGSAGPAPLDRPWRWHATIQDSGNWMTLASYVPEYVVISPGLRGYWPKTWKPSTSVWTHLHHVRSTPGPCSHMRLKAVAQLWTTPESCDAISPGSITLKNTEPTLPAPKNTRMSKVKKVADRPQGGSGAQPVSLQYSAAPAQHRYGIWPTIWGLQRNSATSPKHPLSYQHTYPNPQNVCYRFLALVY